MKNFAGLKRSLTDVLFASIPKDLPSALALVQEVTSNHDIYAFEANFAGNIEDKEHNANANKLLGHLSKELALASNTSSRAILASAVLSSKVALAHQNQWR